MIRAALACWTFVLLCSLTSAQSPQLLVEMTGSRGLTANGKGGFLGVFPGAGPFTPVPGDLGRAVAFTDLDGDGYDDMVVGAPRLPFSAQGQVLDDAGHVYVLFGGADKGLVTSSPTFDFANFATGTALNYFGNAGDMLGASVAAAGDVNGDGFQDVILGAPNRTIGGRTSAGGAYIVFGSADFRSQAKDSTLSLVALTTRAVFVQGARAFSANGTSVSGAVDANGDGRADVVLGAPLDSSNAHQQNGTATVLYGQAGFPSLSVLDLATLGAGDVTVVHGAADFQFLGRSVAGIGRFDAVLPMTAGQTDPVNGDDVAIGAPGTQGAAGLFAGAVYVLRGVPSGTPAAAYTSADFGNGDNTAGVVYGGAGAGDQAGQTVARIGNMLMNPAGFESFAIGAPFNDGVGKADSSSIYIVPGGVGPQGFGLDQIPIGAAIQMAGAATNHGQLGVAVCSAGDLNDDGVRDVVVGHPNAALVVGADVAIAAGRVRLLDGATLLASNGLVNLGIQPGATLLAFSGEASGDYAGAALAAGHHDGEAHFDVAVGAPGAASPPHPADLTGVANRETGRAHIIYGPITKLAGLSPSASHYGGPSVTISAQALPEGAVDVLVEGVPAQVLSVTTGVNGSISFAPPPPPSPGILADVEVHTTGGVIVLPDALQYTLLSIASGPTPPTGFAGNSAAFTGGAFSFSSDTSVTIEGVPATVAAVNGGAGTMSVVLPAGPTGDVPLDVVVTNSNGSVTLVGAMTYLPLVVGAVTPASGPQTSGIFVSGATPFAGTPSANVAVTVDVSGSGTVGPEDLIVQFGTDALGYHDAIVNTVVGNVVSVSLPYFLLGPATLVNVRVELVDGGDAGIHEAVFTYLKSDFKQLPGLAQAGLLPKPPVLVAAGEMKASGNMLLLMDNLGGSLAQAGLLYFGLSLFDPPVPSMGGFIGVNAMPQFIFMLPGGTDTQHVSQVLPDMIDPAVLGMSVYMQLVMQQTDGMVTQHAFTDVLQLTMQP